METNNEDSIFHLDCDRVIDSTNIKSFNINVIANNLKTVFKNYMNQKTICNGDDSHGDTDCKDRSETDSDSISYSDNNNHNLDDYSHGDRKKCSMIECVPLAGDGVPGIVI